MATLTTAETARLLRIHRSTVYRLLRQHPERLPPVVRMGWGFRFFGVRAWLDEKANEARRRRRHGKRRL